MHLKRAYLQDDSGPRIVRLDLENGDHTTKTGSLEPAVGQFIERLRPHPDYTYALCNAMGHSEFFGDNSNADWYGYNPHMQFNGLLHAWDGIGVDQEADKQRGRSWLYGYPCFYNAAVYAHHKNTDPVTLGFGDVIYVHNNNHMRRIELVMRITNQEARKKGHSSILDRVLAGERAEVSMGARVPFDLCATCTDWGEIERARATFNPAQHQHEGIAVLSYHRRVRPIRGLAVTRKEYCQCMLTAKRRIYPDGRKVFVYNDYPRFFDISFVYVGADRTAKVMWFLGQAATTPTPSPPNSLGHVIDLLLGRTSTAKLASMEKEIPSGLVEAIQQDAEAAPDIDTSALSFSPHETLSTLAALGIVASPREFQRLVLPPMLSKELDHRHLIFDTSCCGGVLDNEYAVRPEFFKQELAHALLPWMGLRSAYSPFLNARLLNPLKMAGSPPAAARTELLDKLANQYAGYRLSVLESAPEIFPKVASHLGPDIYLQEKSASFGLAALLLGLGPVIHLISSHLKRDSDSQLGPMAKFVADNPTFTAMATIGMGLRAAMALQTAGGVGQAAKMLVNAVRGAI